LGLVLKIQIQRLITDKGGEYVNNNFTSYCTTQGIQMKHIVPYTPQQNGAAERKNHTLKLMANCMIQSEGLSLEYWDVTHYFRHPYDY
jgi:transposase InsO family protein